MQRNFKNLKMVFICSRYGGDPKNLEFAKKCVRNETNRDNASLPPHLVYGQVLDETTERRRGMDYAKAWMLRCDEVHVYSQHGISPGMAQEMAFAADHEIKTVIMDAI